MGRFDPDEQKVLLALSQDGYRWRTRERIAEVTGLDPQVVDEKLSDLISADLVRPSFSKKKEIIFGLRERVD
jgi:hypothetical protein